MKFSKDLIDAYVKKGIHLSTINPGSREVAVPRDLALESLEYLREHNVAVLGGDVLALVDGTLQYTTDNWHCARRSGESCVEFAVRSSTDATSYISGFKPEENALFVLVLEESSADNVS